MAKGYLNRLKAQGFDESYHIPFTSEYKVKCSCCDALAINNYPCHETGCPNTKYNCKGCDTIIEYRGYCEDCQ